TGHTWGILEGLDIEKATDDTILIHRGSAFDSSGATVIVPEDAYVSTADFTSQGMLPAESPEGAQYPLFLVGTRQRKQPNGLADQCGQGQANRIQDGYRLQFGNPSDANGWDGQDDLPPAAGPDDTPSGRRLLLGFVNLKDGKFVSASLRNADGV